MKILFPFLFLIAYNNNLFAQSLTINVEFPKFDTFNYLKDLKTQVSIKVVNKNLIGAKVSNIKGHNFYYDVEKEVNGMYISLNDSTCYNNSDYILPEGGMKLIDFKKGESIFELKYFPPFCCSYKSAKYRVRCVFWYYINNERKVISSSWKNFNTNN